MQAKFIFKIQLNTNLSMIEVNFNGTLENGTLTDGVYFARNSPVALLRKNKKFYIQYGARRYETELFFDGEVLFIKPTTSTVAERIVLTQDTPTSPITIDTTKPENKDIIKFPFNPFDLIKSEEK